MTKLTHKSLDGVAANIDKLATLFPNCVTETLDAQGKPKRAIDFDMLRQELSGELVEGRQERYQFTWPDKRKAILAANAPISATLRPVREDSVNFDTTENLYIEGDNLDVLKLLQSTYMGKVKMIYIDPPYNTGNDFVYNDDFAEDTESYLADSGQFDEQGNRLVTNTESNGRFHTDWLNMMYPRLKLAKNLLADDGAIFISIDDNEIKNMRNLCDEVFSESNFISQIIVQNNPRGRQSDKFVATAHEYLIGYAKNADKCSINGMPLTKEQAAEYCYTDENGKYRLLGLRQRGVASLREDRPEMFFPIFVNPQTMEVSLTEKKDWKAVFPKKSDGRDGRWMWGKQKCQTDFNRLVPKLIERRGEFDIFVKDYLIRDGGIRTRKYKSIWDDKCINNQVGTQEVKQLLNGDYMSFPKSRAYIQMICQMGSTQNDIIMDFFSGSATTAHAVMKLNAEDGGHRKFIMVQLPEVCDEKSEAYKAGYRNICEIGKERIRRAGAKIQAEQENAQLSLMDNSTLHSPNSKLDTGFRVLRLDSSNMQEVFLTPEQTEQISIDSLADNIKPDRTPEDLLFQVMLELGIPLSASIKETTLSGKTVFEVAHGYLLACFDEDVTEDTVTEIAKRDPYYAVFRDSSMANDSVASNFEQIFETYSTRTVRRVL